MGIGVGAWAAVVYRFSVLAWAPWCFNGIWFGIWVGVGLGLVWGKVWVRGGNVSGFGVGLWA